MLKDLVVSLETAKKLKATGWTKPTAFYWVDVPGQGWVLSEKREECFVWVNPDGGTACYSLAAVRNYFAAPTAEEILRELPNLIVTKTLNRCRTYSLLIKPANLGYVLTYGAIALQSAPTLSEAAAQMWLWCIEQGYIKTEAKP